MPSMITYTITLKNAAVCVMMLIVHIMQCDAMPTHIMHTTRYLTMVWQVITVSSKPAAGISCAGNPNLPLYCPINHVCCLKSSDIKRRRWHDWTKTAPTVFKLLCNYYLYLWIFLGQISTRILNQMLWPSCSHPSARYLEIFLMLCSSCGVLSVAFIFHNFEV